MIKRRRRSPLPEWAIPLCYAVSALVAGIILPRFEHHFLPHSTSSINPTVALTILSSLTSGMIALTGIVFSLAFVMVQFSAIAYSPRLVTWVSGDPVIWHSVGVFTATFLYGIGVMAWIDRAGSGHVPFFSVWLEVLLTFASVGMFIALIQRVGLLQINRMLTFTGNLGREVIEEMYPPLETPPSVPDYGELKTRKVTQIVVHSGHPQALQSLDLPSMLALAEETGGIVEILVAVGDTLISGMRLLRVLDGNHLIDEKTWRRAFEMGNDRTFDQDPKYAIRLLVDIAIKALSPAVNDPSTAVQSLHQIQDQLLRLGRRRLEIGVIRNKQGAVKLIIPHPQWGDFLRLAFEEIRYCGATSVQVMRRMRASINDLIDALPPERHPDLQHHLRRLDETVSRSFSGSEDKEEASVEDRQGLGVPTSD